MTEYNYDCLILRDCVLWETYLVGLLMNIFNILWTIIKPRKVDDCNDENVMKYNFHSMSICLML